MGLAEHCAQAEHFVQASAGTVRYTPMLLRNLTVSRINTRCGPPTSHTSRFGARLRIPGGGHRIGILGGCIALALGPTRWRRAFCVEAVERSSWHATASPRDIQRAATRALSSRSPGVHHVYCLLLRSKISMDGKAVACIDNIFVERLWRHRLKYEEVLPVTPTTACRWSVAS